MGYSCSHNIEKAGIYLLGLLKAVGRVRYSRFYDGTDATHDALLREIGFPIKEGGRSYKPASPEGLMDLAAWELEEEGLVKTTMLEDELADGEQDYLIELTDQGRSFVERGERFQFWDAE